VWRARPGTRGWNYDRECGLGYVGRALKIGKEPPKPVVACATVGTDDGPGFIIEPPPEPTTWEQAVAEP
jgi:hypothetical protein